MSPNAGKGWRRDARSAVGRAVWLFRGGLFVTCGTQRRRKAHTKRVALGLESLPTCCDKLCGFLP